MRFRAALQKAGKAARANFLPGLLLQGILLVFLALYFWHDGTRHALERVARLKQESGYAFAFISYVIAAALLPELLRIAFFQSWRMTGRNVWNFLTVAPFWGGMGMAVDLLYRLQVLWFGSGNSVCTVILKVCVDQFLFSPFFSIPLIVGYLHWREARFRPDALRETLSLGFLVDRAFPVLVTGWCVWIPGVTVVYIMPSPLQIPVAVLIQVFYVLILTTVSERRTGGRREGTEAPIT